MAEKSRRQGFEAVGHMCNQSQRRMDTHTPALGSISLLSHSSGAQPGEQYCPRSVCVFPHQLTQSRQPSIDVPMGQPDLDNPHCNSPKIPDCITMAIKTSNHTSCLCFLRDGKHKPQNLGFYVGSARLNSDSGLHTSTLLAEQSLQPI